MSVPLPSAHACHYALEARGLVKRYGETTALGGVDLAVRTGTVTAVRAERCREDDGRADPRHPGRTRQGRGHIAGFDVRTQAGEVRRRIGLAAQDATVDPLLTGCRENLVMMGELHQLARKDAAGRASSSPSTSRRSSPEAIRRHSQPGFPWTVATGRL